MMYRLPPVLGEWLDRTRPLRFKFAGRHYQGFAGDTITSALAGAGVMIFGRSCKHQRPRGILSFADRDANALFQLDTTAKVHGDIQVLAEGMCVRVLDTADRLARWRLRCTALLAGGFHYRVLRSKQWLWLWRWFLRLSGLAPRVVSEAMPSSSALTRKRHEFCDVLVIGGGRSGVAAALAAAQAGAQVLLVDEQPRLTGEAAHAIQTQPRIRVSSGAAVASCYADHCCAVVGPCGLTKVRARAIVLASGALEQPLVFRNNDLPGVLLASAAQRLVQRHAIAVGRAVAVATNNRAGYEAALLLLEHGIAVHHIIDERSMADADLGSMLQERGVQVLRHRRVAAARAGSDGCVCGVSLVPSTQPALGEREQLACDALLMSGGWTPALQLLLQAGGKVTFNEAAQMHVVIRLPAGWYVAGGANCILDAQAKRVDGQRAGAAAAGCNITAAERQVFPVRGKLTPLAIHADPQGMDFVDFDQDLQVSDLQRAALQGCDSLELLQRYTGLGKGLSQGQHSTWNATRVLSGVRGLPADQVGLPTATSLHHPVPLRHLAGRHHRIERTTPLEQWHHSAGAVWMQVGAWRRPRYYSAGATVPSAAIAAEAAAVRSAAGMIDVGTLGKIEVHGRHAAEFLERAFTGRYSNLKVGKSGYGLLLDEAGNIVDDGVISRLHAQMFYCITSSARAERVHRELTRLCAQWRLECTLIDLTGHYTAFSLAGPRSREVLAAVSSIHPSDAAIPYLALRSAQIAGVRVRMLRLALVSELEFEIHVPFSQALQVWEALYGAGKPLGLRPCGVEAQQLLRLERGHFIIGQDTDEWTNPFEAQAGWALHMDKPFFLGQRSLRILERRGPRQLLVGVELPGNVPALQAGHLIIDREQIAGRITSVGHSPGSAKTLGLALVQPSLAAPGTQLSVRSSNGKLLPARVCATPFLEAASSQRMAHT